MPAIAIPNSAMPAVLRGFVDRVDLWEDATGRFLRVTDYKTGQKKFDYCDISQGIGLQMLLYLFALGHGGRELFGEGLRPGGVEYFPARAPYLKADAPLDPAEAEEERVKAFSRSGLFLEDRRVLGAMEPEVLGDRLPVVEKKDGSLTGSLATSEQFRLLEGYVFHLLADMVSEIASGSVSPNPYSRGTAHDACRFCPYAPVCHPEKEAQRRNYRALKAQEFWEQVEKEETHG